jgi:hypothetical protein
MWIPDTRVVVRPTVLPVAFVAKRQVCAADRIGFAEEEELIIAAKIAAQPRTKPIRRWGVLDARIN